MEPYYIFAVIVLFGLAVSDLIVGVSNDAVNFLNSAIGAKTGSRALIMTVASLGVLIGATFSSGMMEVAREGIFHPNMFLFSEIMIIFMAVMITDVILLDMFNTFGLPTSTTVSIVFEILGAAVAVSILKVSSVDGDMSELASYINTSKALVIISGILLSIAISFTVGAIIQYFTRLLFTFNYAKKMKYFGSVWGGLSITAITYFMVIKGAKGSSFVTPNMLDYLNNHTFEMMVASFIVWTIILQLLMMIVNLNIPKTIVLAGTFALAMAFAGNDLVNFIGVPLAGYHAFLTLLHTPGATADTLMMTALKGKVQTPTSFLLVAGIIMILTLWLNKKSRLVTETSVNLSRQDEGAERFGSSLLSRSIVRGSMNIGIFFNQIMPLPLKRGIDRRFEPVLESGNVRDADKPAFDMVRAAVNLTVASILISYATSMKLPLSTTYVTFMVAMGSSLADRAWGRESAVYRITGVFTVIGGWFLTAFVAFLVTFIFANLIYAGGAIAVILLLMLALTFIYRTYHLHRIRNEIQLKSTLSEQNVDAQMLIQNVSQNVVDTLSTVQSVFEDTITGLATEDRKKLKNARNEVQKLNEQTRYLRNNIANTIQKLEMEEIETGHYYVQEIDYIREIVTSLRFVTEPAYNHINNNHKGLIPEQIQELTVLNNRIMDLFNTIKSRIKEERFDDYDLIEATQEHLVEDLEKARKRQIKRIKNKTVGTKNSLLYLGILNEGRNILSQVSRVLRAQRDFVG